MLLKDSLCKCTTCTPKSWVSVERIWLWESGWHIVTTFASFFFLCNGGTEYSRNLWRVPHFVTKSRRVLTKHPSSIRKAAPTPNCELILLDVSVRNKIILLISPRGLIVSSSWDIISATSLDFNSEDCRDEMSTASPRWLAWKLNNYWFEKGDANCSGLVIDTPVIR